MTKKKKVVIFLTTYTIIVFALGVFTSNFILPHHHEEGWYDEIDENVPDTIKSNRESDIIYINDEEYYDIACDDISDNYGIYEGKTVRIKGIFEQEKAEKTDNKYNYIGRYVSKDGNKTPDDWYGFEFVTENELPPTGTEITVEGTVGMYDVQGELFLALLDCSIETE